MPLKNTEYDKSPVASVNSKYVLIVEHINMQIREGALQAGDRLPTFSELQKTFSVTPNTVNRAMIALEQNGMIVREHRRGVFVARQIHAKERRKGVRDGKYLLGLAGFSFPLARFSNYWSTILDSALEAAEKMGISFFY